MANLQTNRVFLIAFLVSFLSSGAFLITRGAGWDGDSLVLASQFSKICNPDIFSASTPITQPKLMSIFIFGIFYKIFGNLYALTFLSMTLNSLMTALICKWVSDNDGYWLIAMFGIVTYIGWLDVVISCNTPAFSLPFTFFGLYRYYHNKKKITGGILILIAALFRPGPEIIILSIIIIELLKGTRRIPLLAFLFFLFIIGIIHTLFGYKLALTKESFTNNVLTMRVVEKYRYSATAIWPYIESILSYLLSKPRAFLSFLLSLFGIMQLARAHAHNDIKYSALVIFANYLLPAGTFMYGITAFDHMYYMETMILLAIFPSFFCYKSAFIQKMLTRIKPAMICKVAAVFFLTAAIAFVGLKRRGSYEANPDGSGVLKWKSVAKIRSLFPAKKKLTAAVINTDAVFFMLDFGLRLEKLDILHHVYDISDIQYQNYDVILMNSSAPRYHNNIYSLFDKFYIDSSRIIFIRKPAISDVS